MSQRATTVDEVGTQISTAIMVGELPVGTWLRQETLAKRFGVSRQPIREALRQLQASGMVEVFPNRGAVVRGPSPREIVEAYLVRSELEGLAAELATARLTPEVLVRLGEAESAFRHAAKEALDATIGDFVTGDYGWGQANDAFHETILNAAGVPVLTETIRSLHKTIPRNLTWSAIRSRALFGRKHPPARGDPARARGGGCDGRARGDDRAHPVLG